MELSESLLGEIKAGIEQRFNIAKDELMRLQGEYRLINLLIEKVKEKDE